MGNSTKAEVEQEQVDARKRAPSSLFMGLTALAISAVLLAGGLWYLSLQLSNRRAEVVSGAPSIGGPFTLINAEGKSVTDRDFLGRYMLIYFGYTFCPDVCPTTLAKMSAALDQLGERGNRVQALFITIDPKRDTPGLIGQYTKAFSPRLIGLTGTAEQVATAEKEYRVYAAEHRTGAGSNDYTMDHSGIVYLMGPDGRFVAVIRADDDAGTVASDIAKHLS
jgi:protein SCO1/2